MTDDAIPKSGRGGKRPGAGRPRTDWKSFTVKLPGDESARLIERAQAAGKTPYAWIVDTVRKAIQEDKA